MQMKRFILIIWALLLAIVVAGGEMPVRVGIAWQPTAAAYERVIMSIEQAGGEAVILPQLRPAGFDYDDMVLCPKYTDEMGVLRQQYADVVKHVTYHGTNADSLLAGVQAVVFLGGGDISSTLFAVPQPWHAIADDSPANATRDANMAFYADQAAEPHSGFGQILR